MPDIFKRHNILPEEEIVQIPDHTDFREMMEEERAAEDRREAAFRENTADEGTDKTKQNGAEAAFSETEFVPMTKDEIAAFYQEELLEICSEAREKAYSDALLKKRGELSECIQRVDTQLAEMQELQEEFIQRYSQELKYLAIEIAEKMLVEKIEENDTILEKLVMKNIRDVKKAPWIDVEISDRLVNLVEKMKVELDRPEYHGRATVTPTASPLDTCRITTEEGTVVAGISAQAKNLRDAFRAAEKK